MKITNRLGLPESLVEAVKNDPYDAGLSDITVTQLISPPQMRIMKITHGEVLSEDVADRIWALLGQAVHVVLERADESNTDTLSEIRFSYKIDDLMVSGQADRFVLSTGTLQDYKVTSVWSYIFADKPEWEQQLNLLAMLARANGYEVNKLEIVAIYRDWSQTNYERNPSEYPPAPAMVIDIPMWNEHELAEFMSHRLALHKQAMDGNPPLCSDEERWYSGDKWALMRGTNKTATKLHDSFSSCHNDYTGRGGSETGYWIQHRPGVYKRCQSYCAVAPVCQQWRLDVEKDLDGLAKRLTEDRIRELKRQSELEGEERIS